MFFFALIFNVSHGIPPCVCEIYLGVFLVFQDRNNNQAVPLRDLYLSIYFHLQTNLAPNFAAKIVFKTALGLV